MNDMSRRNFLMTAAATAVVISLPVLEGYADDAPAKPPTTTIGGTVNVGAVGSFDRDGIYDKWAKSGKFFIIRLDGQLYAATSICTHRGAQLVAEGNKDFYCPRHKSYFSPEGTVTGGPAKSSLPRYAIALDDQKHVIVDKSKSFREVEWTDPACFIDLKPA